MKIPSSLRKVNDEIFIVQDPIARIGPAETAFIKAQAAANDRKRARICAHKRNEDSLHEMIIAISAKSYIHPHRHLGKSESFHIIEGIVDVVVFDEDGNIADIIGLGDPATGRAYYYRLDQSLFHTLLIKSDFLVVHEVTNGPFLREKTEMAPWAPTEGNIADTNGYMEHLIQLAKSRRSAAH